MLELNNFQKEAPSELVVNIFFIEILFQKHSISWVREDRKVRYHHYNALLKQSKAKTLVPKIQRSQDL